MWTKIQMHVEFPKLENSINLLGAMRDKEGGGVGPWDVFS